MKVRSKNSLTVRLINNPGCIVRVALLMERRGYSIESLQMKSITDGHSDMMLVVSGEPEKWEQVQKQLAKLVDVIFVKEGIREEVRKSYSWTSSISKALTRSI
jgi:acetolactate synthase small subunit